MNKTQKTPEQAALAEKLQDLEQGFEVEMTPEEADYLGGFREEALSEQEAQAGRDDYLSFDDDK
jgi:hypothetical protein